MESTKHKLIEWDVIYKKDEHGDILNPIDLFLFENEPAGDDSIFRSQLEAALLYEDDEYKTERNSKIVSSFIEHCKTIGIDIPDSAFESYFDA